ncbi:MAG: DUF2220 domain-containing protein [Lachnospiraceae bacterium]|nr:DUF2220 domain-containing protein [Lachnospiraceae bacterium]
MKKRITLETLLARSRKSDYKEQYSYITGLLEAGRIRPLKASGKNGKKPALYREYWLVEEKEDFGPLLEELKFCLVPTISVDYYQSHLEVYHQERPWVLLLDAWLRKNKNRPLISESVNERSFEIWGREKFLTKEQGKKILKHCGIPLEALNLYETTEPLSYYAHTRTVPQNLLILENKDTFYSMRRHLLDGTESVFRIPIGTLIYGAGKGILRSFQDFDLCVEPYMTDRRNQIWYFGDLDYEGIGIWEKLAELCQPRRQIRPFCPAYEAMLKKAEQIEVLPDTREQQNRNIGDSFFQYFSEEISGKMKQVLENETYIPQEILNITDFS